MSAKIILPKTYVEIDESYGPLFFLPGPVRAGKDWQVTGCAEIEKHFSDFYVAIPYYHDRRNPLSHRATPGDENYFAKLRQRHWERHYLIEAAKKGCIIFWLPAEDPTDPRLKEDGPYGQDTYGELGRYSVEKKYNPHYRMVIGGELGKPASKGRPAVPGFYGLELIMGNHGLDLGRNVPLYPTLEKTIAAAAKLVLKGTKKKVKTKSRKLNKKRK